MESELTDTDDGLQPPARLRALTSWQANKVSLLGARMIARHMPLSARPDFAVMAALEEYGELSQADLGRRLGFDRNEVSGIAARLQRGQYIDRHVDPGNRRRNVVTLTEAGRRYLEEIQRHADAAQDELLAGLNAAERLQLNELLAKVLSSHRPQPA
jgi:DNA-binding MarR family transcriptional regulator